MRPIHRELRVELVTILLSGLFLPSLARGQSQSAAQPNFQIEIQTGGDPRPGFTVTNSSEGTLTACVFRFTDSSQSRSLGEMVWDSVIQSVTNPNSNPRHDPLLPQEPLEPQASMTWHSLPRVIGGPFPDKVEIVAGVWSDGATFGEDEWVKVILKYRATLARDYENAISLLRTGQDQNWDLEKYLSVLKHEPNSLPFIAIRSTFEAVGVVQTGTVNALIASFTRRLDRLHQAKPSVTNSASL